MIKLIFKLFCFCFFLYGCKTTYKHDTFFTIEKEYHYRVLYIDSLNDTITNELLVMKPLNKRWSAQPWLQEAVQYKYYSDTNSYKKFISPNPSTREMDNSYYKKHHTYRIKESEITGGVNNQDYFFLHPPRINQYFMLRYAAFPVVEYKYLTDSTTQFNFHLGEKMKYDHVYLISPFRDSVRTKYHSNNEKLWEMKVESTVTGLTDYWKQYPIFNSNSLLIYSRESGFIMMHHNFENGIKIHFDLIEIIQK